MRIELDGLAGVVVLERAVHSDTRGWVSELYRAEVLAARGVPPFVQANLSRSTRGVVRGLHFQRQRPQGKLVTAVGGAIFDVVVDVRRGSSTYGCWAAIELDAVGARSLWIPPGFAHGFQALTDDALVLYQLTAVYAPDDEAVIRWDDPTLAISWPLAPAVVSARDAAASLWQR